MNIIHLNNISLFYRVALDFIKGTYAPCWKDRRKGAAMEDCSLSDDEKWRYVVYGLADPRTGAIRYVGKSDTGMDGAKFPRGLEGCEAVFIDHGSKSGLDDLLESTRSRLIAAGEVLEKFEDVPPAPEPSPAPATVPSTPKPAPEPSPPEPEQPDEAVVSDEAGFARLSDSTPLRRLVERSIKDARRVADDMSDLVWVLKEVLSGLENRSTRSGSRSRDVIKAAAKHYGVQSADLLSESKVKRVTRARAAAMFVCREYLSMSFPDIAHAFGGRHHTTVMHAVQRVLDNPEIMKEATEIKRTIKGINSWPR